MGNPQRVSRISSHTIQRNQRTRNKLSGTATGTNRRRRRVGNRTNPRQTPLRPRKEITISRKMEGLLTRSRSMGRQVRHNGQRTNGGIRKGKQRRTPTSQEYKNPEEKSKRDYPLHPPLPHSTTLSSINAQQCQYHRRSTSARQ